MDAKECDMSSRGTHGLGPSRFLLGFRAFVSPTPRTASNLPCMVARAKEEEPAGTKEEGHHPRPPQLGFKHLIAMVIRAVLKLHSYDI